MMKIRRPLTIPNSSSQTNQTNECETAKEIKIRPIILHEAANHQVVIKDLKANTKSEFTTMYKHTKLRINLTDPDDYRM